MKWGGGVVGWGDTGLFLLRNWEYRSGWGGMVAGVALEGAALPQHHTLNAARVHRDTNPLPLRHCPRARTRLRSHTPREGQPLHRHRRPAHHQAQLMATVP